MQRPGGERASGCPFGTRPTRKQITAKRLKNRASGKAGRFRMTVAPLSTVTESYYSEAEIDFG